MPIQILMPALSPTMEKGNLAKWLKKEGDKVTPGDVIAEIETDKATMEVEAADEGKVSKLLIAEGTEGVKVNTPIAVLLADGEKEGAPTVAKQPSPPAKGPTPRAPTPGRVLGCRGFVCKGWSWVTGALLRRKRHSSRIGAFLRLLHEARL